MTELEDNDLVANALAGNARSFDVLVRRHQDRVYAVAMGIVRSPEDAADVAQETFVAVVRNLDTFRFDAQFTTWLHRITIRKAYDHLRKRTPTPVDPADHVISNQVNPRDSVGDGVAANDILRSVNELDEHFRAAVLLVDIAGVSITEAATMLEVAEGTVKSRVFRGRAMLAKALGTLGHRSTSQ